MRRKAKRDAVEPVIVAALRDAGWKVIFCYEPMPFDLIAHRRGEYAEEVELLEVKSKGGRLTESQKKALAEGWPFRVVRSLDDILDLLEERG